MALSRFFRTFVPDMKEVTIQDAVLRKAASEGMDAFVACFVHAIKEEIGGELTAETLGMAMDYLSLRIHLPRL